MKLKVNGKEESLELVPPVIASLLRTKQVAMPEMVSVEVNGEIVERNRYQDFVLNEGDNVEFLYFMGGGQKRGIGTLAVHHPSGRREGGLPAVHEIQVSSAFAYADPEELADVFRDRKFGYVYSRIANPTVAELENRMTLLNAGLGSLATASGMAAIATAILPLAGNGEEIAVGRSLFGGTFHFFESLLPRWGIRPVFFDPADAETLAKAVTPATRGVFVETIGNPKLDVPDLKELSALAHRHGLPLVADATLTPPGLLDPTEYGIDIVVHSATKYLSGHGAAVGGILTDTGLFDWASTLSPAIRDTARRAGKRAFLVQAGTEFRLNLGMILPPFNAFLIGLGIETLPLRMEKHCSNALALASFLSRHPAVREVNYPGLETSPFHRRAADQFGRRFGGILTFRLASQDACFDFIRKLTLALNLPNIGDHRTLVIHPWSTIYQGNTEQQRKDAGVTENLIRVSAGIETEEDILEDFDRALGGRNGS